MDQDADLLIEAVNEVARLVESDGSMVYLYDDASTDLRFAYDAGVTSPQARELLRGLRLPLGKGVFGTALARREPVLTDDYPADDRFEHHGVADQIVAEAGMRSMVAAPMLANDQPIGVLGAFSNKTAAFGQQQLALLRALADHAAAAIGNRRLLADLVFSEERLRLQTAELERLVAGQRALEGISRRIVDVADSAEVLQDVVDVAARLLGSDGAHLTLMNDERTALIPMVTAGTTEPSVRQWLHDQRFPLGGGINGLAAASGQAAWTEDYVNDPRIPHDPDDDSAVRLELGAVTAVPLSAPGGEVIGTLAITYRKPRTIDRRDVTLLEDLARQAAIAARNSRLYAELRDRTKALARVVEVQRTLSEIAVQITSLHDPTAILQRTVEEAARLLGADFAEINPIAEDGKSLEPAIAFSPRDHPDDTTFAPGVGVTGLAIAEQRVVYTPDYAADTQFRHTPEGDAYVARHGIRSVMAAPLIGGGGAIGTLTVDARRAGAFTQDDQQLLATLGAQAAIAIRNARLFSALEQSERRYRHLVDHLPDLVWAVDADGRMTYVSEVLERLTGYTPDRLLGRYWVELLSPASQPLAEATWSAIRERPNEEVQIRVQTPLAGGGTLNAEVSMIGTVVDGHFAGAHGSLRDISERELLEADLRRRSAEVAASGERANLARELHDSVTQALFSMGLTLRTVELLMDRDPEAARVRLADLRELQNDALAEMRTLIFELRPQGLEESGLGPALRNHAAAVQGRTGLAVAVEVSIDDRLPADTEETLYRIAQEALHNVVKHANARQVWIRLRRSGRYVALTVEDDGSGFDPAQVSGAKLGLVGMRQRADQAGGRLHIRPRPAGGTHIAVTLPVENMNGADPLTGAPEEQPVTTV